MFQGVLAAREPNPFLFDSLSRNRSVEDEQLMTEEKILSRPDQKISCACGFLFEIVLAKGIGGEQAVGSGVPPGRVSRIILMIEECHGDLLAIHWTGVSDPASSFSPDLASGLSVGIESMTGGHRSVDAQGWGEAQGKSALGVAREVAGPGASAGAKTRARFGNTSMPKAGLDQHKGCTQERRVR